jgi:phosphatidylserine decarboxylase
MTLHKEGFPFLFYVFFGIAALAASLIIFLGWNAAGWPVLALAVAGFFFFVQFFRYPSRSLVLPDDGKNYIVAPADGKVVVIEELDEKQYLHKRCIQVSIFMAAYNVHANWAPVRGKILLAEHVKGRFGWAIEPKSSQLNERGVCVIEHPTGEKIVVKQIAGTVARRIVTYLRQGQDCVEGTPLGFIKFGSRLDVLIPLGADIKVGLNQKTVGNQTILATF